MGTNIYWLLDEHREENKDDPDTHIGKREGAGLYCRPCGVTLCREGAHMVHATESTWFEKCPACGGPGQFVGSFTFTKRKHLKALVAMKPGTVCVVSEAGNRMTAREALQFIRQCPIHFQNYHAFS
jgi:hypothetical protein